MDLFIPLISFMFLCISSWTSYLNFSVATGYTNSLTVSLCTEPVSLVFLTYLSMLKYTLSYVKYVKKGKNSWQAHGNCTAEQTVAYGMELRIHTTG